MTTRAPRFLLAGAAITVLALLVALLPGVRSGTEPVTALDDVAQPLGYGLASAAAAWGAVGARGWARVGWALVAAALAMRMTALLLAIHLLDRRLVDPFPAGGAWATSIVLLIAGLVFLERANRPAGSRVLALDAVMGALAAAAVGVTVYEEALEGLAAAALPGAAFRVEVLFPAAEIGLVSVFAGVLAGTHLHLSRTVLMLGAGVVGFVVSDGFLLQQLAAQELRPGTLLSPLSLGSTVLIAGAPWAGATPVAHLAAREADLRVPRLLSVACLGVLLLDAVEPVSVPPLGVVLAVAALAVGLTRTGLTQLLSTRRSEATIAEKDEELLRFRALVEASADYIGIGTLQGRILFLNPAARRMSGMGPDDSLDDFTIARALTDEAAVHQHEVERPQIMTTGSWKGESAIRDQSGGGRPVPVYKNTFMIRDDAGAPWLLGTIMRDITELKEAESYVERFRSLVEASSDFIALAELDGTVRYLNPAGRRMVGMDPEDDVEQTSISDFLTEEGLRASVEVEQPAVVADGEWRGESTLRHQRGGPPIPVTINSFLIRRPETGEPWLLATVQRNITELHAARTELQRLADDRQELLRHLVEAQEAERSRIAADVHDDPVQVMAAVDLQLGLVQRQLESTAGIEQTRALLEQMRSTVSEANDRLRYLLFDLDSPAQREDVETALGEAAAYVLKDTVRWDVRCEAGLDLDETARVLVYRIAKEAMVNVRKHAQADRVRIDVRRLEDGVEVVVADDGVGLPPGHVAPRPGHRGISDMRDRAAIAGGSVTLTDGPERGAVMRLWIPVSANGD